jgi:hypothetical protein
MLRYNLAQLEKGVSLSKPRERAAPGPLGAVTYEPPQYAPPPPDDVDDDAATQPAAEPTGPVTPRVAPQSRPSVERLRLNLPLPSTQPAPSSPSPLLPPFKPVPAK